MWSADELIVAPGTADGSGARSIVRIAGDGLASLLASLFEPFDAGGHAAGGSPPRVVSTHLGGLLAADWGPVPVEVLHWPGPGGPIGGPLAEVHLPCSAPLVDALIAAACRYGARVARGGEFTLRAFLAGRLDLVQAEAVLAVVEAGTPAQLSAALDRLAGGSGATLRRLRDDLLDLLADVEASIDFADETTPDALPGLDTEGRHALAAQIERTAHALAAARAALAGRGIAGADVPCVVLVGPPNVGKSSLYNALTKRDAALVADARGTTRDRLETRLELALPDAGAALCVLVDVAGMVGFEGVRPAHRNGDAPGVDPAMEAEAVARRALADADVVVFCHDAEAGIPPRAEPSQPRPRIDVLTRCDRVEVPGMCAPRSSSGIIATSSLTGEGLAALTTAIATAVSRLPPRASPATVRLADGLDTAAAAMAAAGEMMARDVAAGSFDEALLAGHLRAAAETLGEVTGVELGPDLLDRVFSRHCIGK